MIGQGYWVSSLAENYRNQVFTPLINSAQVYLNSNQLDLPIMEINSSDVITVSFDWLSMEYAHLAYRIEHCNWDWTPSAGKWFLDAGVGVNIGGAKHFMYVGVAGQAKFGIKFNKVPIRLAVDVTPAFGPYFHLPYSEMVEVPNASGGVDKVKVKYGGGAGFYSHGLLNLGLSATYCF